eukprot:CAMPEP_0179492538 /NCGR_PEP_ID=MMETSP0799-20121207/66830_1 /TAXON_ID=46947 /ORGANISM="Geminigera cryophila, Strain CCMP2564" /LENGTH=68 /DNA_ID=CAMNT_0021309373 /DNA_START=38 /DNA_END=244 /DNA_ORIENTATION=-
MSAADCMYAPIALRLRTYDPEFSSLTPVAAEYMRDICLVPAVQEWVRAAEAEGKNTSFKIAQYDALAD